MTTPALLAETIVVDPGLVDDNPWQPRHQVDPAYLEELATDIKVRGLIHCPVVRPHPEQPDRYQCGAGHNRRDAWKKAFPGQPMPVEVRAMGDREIAELSIRENSKRRDLSAIERARALQRYVDEFHVTQETAGQLFGLATQGAVSNLLRLLKLPEDIQGMANRGDLAERHARQFASAAQVLPDKELSKIAKASLKQTDPNDREAFIEDEIQEAVWKNSKPLRMAIWDRAWPGTPIPVDPRNTGKGAPAEIVACDGCPRRRKTRRDDLCTMPACFDLKEIQWRRVQLEHASKRLGIPVATEEQIKDTRVLTRLNILFDGTRYQQQENALALIKAKRATELGLWLLPLTSDGYNYYGREVFGVSGIALATSDKAACDRYLLGLKSGTSKAGSKPLDEAKAKKVEEQEREKRRDERAAALKAQYDVSWLICHAAQEVGKRLHLAGGVLGMLVDEINYSIHDFELLEQFEDNLEDRIHKAKGTEREELLRALVAFRLICQDCCHHDVKGKPKYDLDWILKKLPDLIGNGKEYLRGTRYNDGFGIKTLPAGWNQPPIHKTEFNCWHCGVFAGNAKLSKRDLEAGWMQAVKNKTVIDVRCPNCNHQPADTKTSMAAVKPQVKSIARKQKE
jgi:ParB/RepB/Spo0J family partition protein